MLGAAPGLKLLRTGREKGADGDDDDVDPDLPDIDTVADEVDLGVKCIVVAIDGMPGSAVVVVGGGLIARCRAAARAAAG